MDRGLARLDKNLLCGQHCLTVDCLSAGIQGGPIMNGTDAGCEQQKEVLLVLE